MARIITEILNYRLYLTTSSLAIRLDSAYVAVETETERHVWLVSEKCVRPRVRGVARVALNRVS